jgi:gag-polypeptide of LTR copia-type
MEWKRLHLTPNPRPTPTGNSEAYAQIALTLTDEPLNTILNVSTAKQAWDNLMEHYEGKGEQRIAYLIS